MKINFELIDDKTSNNDDISDQAQVYFLHFKLMMKQFVIKLFFVH